LRLLVLFVGSAPLGKPKIRQLGARTPPFGAGLMVDQNIHRLDVTVQVSALVQPGEGVSRLRDELTQVGVPRHRTVAKVKVAPVKNQTVTLVHPHHPVKDNNVGRASAHRQLTQRVKLGTQQPAGALPGELDCNVR
jgi:hypothetical protein